MTKFLTICLPNNPSISHCNCRTICVSILIHFFAKFTSFFEDRWRQDFHDFHCFSLAVNTTESLLYLLAKRNEISCITKPWFKTIQSCRPIKLRSDAQKWRKLFLKFFGGVEFISRWTKNAWTKFDESLASWYLL